MGTQLSSCASAYQPSSFEQVRAVLTPVTPNPQFLDKLTKTVDQITPLFLVSGSAGAEDVIQLRAQGITHVVNMAEGRRRQSWTNRLPVYEQLGIRYLGISAVDTPEYDLLQHVEQVFDFIDAARAECKRCRILLHCLRGLSRSPAILAAYLMHSQEITAAEAFRLIRAKRFVYPNVGFVRQLVDYDETLCGRRLRRIYQVPDDQDQY